MKPLEVCIHEYGSVIKFADAIGLSRQIVYRWMRMRKQGRNHNAQDGNVPQKHWEKIYSHAQKHGINITMHDLAFGRE